MGEVYRATDTSGRDVAIRCCQAFAHDPERSPASSVKPDARRH